MAGLKYPVHVWWDGPGKRMRTDVYGGMDSAGMDLNKGTSFSLYPRIRELACDFSNGTVGPTAGLMAGLLGGESSDTPLPDISKWTYAGKGRVGNADALAWQLSARHGEKTATYTFYTSTGGWPLKFYMMGVNMLTGSHFDEYIIEFTRYKPGPIADKVFELPAVCAAAQQQQATGEGGRRGALAAQLLSLLPGVKLGGAYPSTTLNSLRARAASHLDANARLVKQHNAAAAAGSTTATTGTTNAAAASTDAPSYTLSLNHFASMSHEQWAATSLGLLPRSLRREPTHGSDGLAATRGSLGSASASLGTYRRVLTDEELPPSVDWRGTGADGPGVKDQASCGSCWAFSAVGALQGAWFKATGEALSFSEQQMVDCSWDYENNGCGGGWVEPAIAYVVGAGLPAAAARQSSGNVEPAIQYTVDAGGISLEQDYPYLGQNAYCRGPAPGLQAKAATRSSPGGPNAPPAPASGARFSGYLNVPPRDEGALMEAVALHGPVAVVLHAALPPFKFYAEGVYFNKECKTDPDHMDHAVLLVGYGTSPDGTDYWLIKNSWSKYWGMDGYARIARKSNDCGITTDPVMAVVDAAAVSARGGSQQAE